MHLADAFIQSDLQCIMCSLGIEPTTFALYHWPTRTLPMEISSKDQLAHITSSRGKLLLLLLYFILKLLMLTKSALCDYEYTVY